MQITKQDLVPLVEALESIKISGSKDIGTMNNVFNYIEALISKIDKEEAEGNGD